MTQPVPITRPVLVAIAVGAWVVSQVLAEDVEKPDRPVDTRAPDADPDEWDEDRMENATSGPMATMDLSGMAGHD